MTRCHHERGIALIAALLFATTILGLVSAIVGSGLSTRNQSRYLLARQGAQNAAESGVHSVLAQMGGPNASTLLAAGQVLDTIRGTGERAPRFDVRLASGAADGVDNDLDGLADEPDEADTIELVSSGTYDGVMRTVRVTLQSRYRTPTFTSATYLDDPAADLNLNGNAFTISGIDVDLAGNPTGNLVAGIGVNGPTNLVEDQIANNQDDNVIGAGGPPSVATVPALDLTDLVEEGARSADVTLAAGGTYDPEPGDWGSLAEPSIVYSSGTVHVSGDAHGAGIMIINGNLIITGEFIWHGLVIVRGQVDFRGGGGNKRLVGALVVEDEFFSTLPAGGGGDPDDGGMQVSGTVDIIFSEQTLDTISQAFASYEILNWREGPNPDYEAAP